MLRNMNVDRSVIYMEEGKFPRSTRPAFQRVAAIGTNREIVLIGREG